MEFPKQPHGCPGMLHAKLYVGAFTGGCMMFVPFSTLPSGA